VTAARDRHGGLTVGVALHHAAERLAESGSDTARGDAEWLLGRVLGRTRSELHLHRDDPLAAPEREALEALVARRAAGEPLQYVLGEWGFRRLALAVDRRALIPRPETEVVVERCLALLDGRDAPRVLDVGTGSGAIALALADEHPGARVTGIDVSEEALALARENAARTGLDVTFRRHDLFEGLPERDWELVVANPPYVRPEELPGLGRGVTDWEPGLALVDRGHTEALVAGARAGLRPGGALVLETHAEAAAATAALLAGHGFADVTTTRDLAGRERVVEGRSA
jgi:release factor glutamine methyltransferase